MINIKYNMNINSNILIIILLVIVGYMFMKNQCNKKIKKKIDKKEKFSRMSRMSNLQKKFQNSKPNSMKIGIKTNDNNENNPKFNIKIDNLKSEFNFLNDYTKCNGNEKCINVFNKLYNKIVGDDENDGLIDLMNTYIENDDGKISNGDIEDSEDKIDFDHCPSSKCPSYACDDDGDDDDDYDDDDDDDNDDEDYEVAAKS